MGYRVVNPAPGPHGGGAHFNTEGGNVTMTTGANMAAEIVSEVGGRIVGTRYIAVAPCLTHEQATAYVSRFLGANERISGFFSFGD